MKDFVKVVVILAVIWYGYRAFTRWVFTQPPTYADGTTPNQHPEYKDVNGDGFVEAQGDPLYDAWYAQNVNPGNTGAKLTLAEEELTYAQADAVRAQASRDRTLERAVVIIMVVVGLFFLFGRRSGS